MPRHPPYALNELARPDLTPEPNTLPKKHAGPNPDRDHKHLRTFDSTRCYIILQHQDLLTCQGTSTRRSRLPLRKRCRVPGAVGEFREHSRPVKPLRHSGAIFFRFVEKSSGRGAPGAWCGSGDAVRFTLHPSVCRSVPWCAGANCDRRGPTLHLWTQQPPRPRRTAARTKRQTRPAYAGTRPPPVRWLSG